MKMFTNRFGLIAFFVLTFTAITGCSVNPVTGERELTIISGAQELAMGQQNYGPYQQMQGGRYVVDPELNLYIRRVGLKLASVSDNPSLPYEFVVLNNGVPNAWALPGGKIAINRGLLVMLKDEAQLASVLAHEIVHAAGRHSARQMTKSTLLGLGAEIAGSLAQGSEYGQLIQMGAGLGAQAWQASYGREQELEADEHGIKYMAKAGYDTKAAIELQELFVALSEGKSQDFISGLFASHPPSQERVRRNEINSAQYASGVRNKEAYLKATQQLRKDAPAYELYQKGLALASKDAEQSLRLVTQATQMQPQEPLFHITKGQLLLQKKQNEQALQSFEKGISLNPEYYMGHVGKGLVTFEQNKLNEAKQSLELSAKFLPTEVAVFYLGEIAYAQQDFDLARQYFEQLSQGQSPYAERARASLAKLPQPAVAQ